MRVKWIGKGGFTPGVGTTVTGQEIEIPSDMLESLKGKYKTLDKKVQVKENDK